MYNPNQHEEILGKWKLISISDADGWYNLPNSPFQAIEFKSSGDYSLILDKVVTCSGKFQFTKDEKLLLSPNNCFPIIESTETILKLDNDTLILTNHSLSFSSTYERKDRYIKF
jgi:hypothetical protein